MAGGLNAMTSLAFLGLGLMGGPMTLNLLRAGHRVHVWNRSPDKLAAAVAAGAIACATPRECADRADVVLMCLFDAAAVEAVVFGEHGIASGEVRGKLLVDHASLPPAATRAFADRLAAHAGMDWVDAPVSGGVSGATAGTLAIMCGGDAAHVDRARPALAAYASNVTHMGPIGAGQTTKLCNQMLVGTNIATIAEVVRLAQGAGIDAAKIPRALAGGYADSRPLQVLLPRMLSGWDRPIATANTFLKDLDNALAVARDTGTPLPMSSSAAELFRAVKAMGWGDDDGAKVVDLMRPGRAGERHSG